MHFSPTVALAAVRSKAVILLLLICCLMYFPLFVGVLCLSICYVLGCVHYRFAIILKRKRKLVALQMLSCRCIVTMNVLWLFVTAWWVGLQYVIVVFPDHTHLLFNSICINYFWLNKDSYIVFMHGSRKFCQRGLKNAFLSSTFFTEGRTDLPQKAIGPYGYGSNCFSREVHTRVFKKLFNQL